MIEINLAECALLLCIVLKGLFSCDLPLLLRLLADLPKLYIDFSTTDCLFLVTCAFYPVFSLLALLAIDFSTIFLSANNKPADYLTRMDIAGYFLLRIDFISAISYDLNLFITLAPVISRHVLNTFASNLFLSTLLHFLNTYLSFICINSELVF